MLAEYRIIITATFNVAADRNAAANNLRTQLINYNTANPGKLKAAHLTKDDYFVAEANETETIV